MPLRRQSNTTDGGTTDDSRPRPTTPMMALTLVCVNDGAPGRPASRMASGKNTSPLYIVVRSSTSMTPDSWGSRLANGGSDGDLYRRVVAVLAHEFQPA